MIKRGVEILKTKIVYSDSMKSLQRERKQLLLSIYFVPSVEDSLALGFCATKEAPGSALIINCAWHTTNSQQGLAAAIINLHHHYYAGAVHNGHQLILFYVLAFYIRFHFF